ncbi:hypothetical protein ANCDUO_02180 [Ancylostoma duodenale]|uniref:Uncharacterized protein n=1 Tax=Ancylostoma duodenale TaxID=51022 RepID=A0A0C2DX46_9BILA|nr:hypothetical protein ANCDUO_02180 [Ancylostoma duodenale]
MSTMRARKKCGPCFIICQAKVKGTVLLQRDQNAHNSTLHGLHVDKLDKCVLDCKIPEEEVEEENKVCVHLDCFHETLSVRCCTKQPDNGIMP